MKRIHEIAKEQGVDATAIIEVLTRAGLPASKCKTSSTVSPEWEARIERLSSRLRAVAERTGAATAKKSARAAKTSGRTKKATTKTSARKKAAPKKSATAKKATTTKKKATKKTTAKKATAKKATAKKTTTKKSTTRKKAAARTTKPKRYTDDSAVKAKSSAPELDAWVDQEEVFEERRSRTAKKVTVKVPAKQQRDGDESQPLTQEEILKAAGLVLEKKPTRKRAKAAKAVEPAVAAKAEAAKAAKAARTAKVVSIKTEIEREAEAIAAAAATAVAAARAEAAVRAEADAERRAVEAAAAKAAAAAAGSEEETDDSGPKRKKRSRAQKRKQAAASREDFGPSLLGDIGQEEEGEIQTALGAIPDAPSKTHATESAAAAGFQKGGGFSHGPSIAGRGQGGRSSGGRRQFFRVGAQGRRRKGRKGGRLAGNFNRPEKVTVSPPITVKDLSAAMGVRVADIIRTFFRKGTMLQQNKALNEDDILEIGLEFDVEIEISKKKEAEEELEALFDQYEDKPADLKSRAPIITILGHVDHGKTTLLDKIRSANVAAGEAGGITQAISAFKVRLPDGKAVVFVDTPGHAAFTEMRARGANVTDVVILVVAADDGVMPQTEEAYAHAKAAGAPIVVVINKIDKANANPAHVKQQLSNLGLQPVEWGGETEVLEISALKGEGIEALLETLALQAEILELKANPKKPASGTCLEARKTQGRGVTANLIVQEGTLKQGQTLVCGSGYGRVRAIFNDRGKEMKKAGPATPVEVIGLETVPEASARFYVLDDLGKAKEIAEKRLQRQRLAELAKRSSMGHVTLESLFEHINQGLQKEIKLILKADARGSIEVLQKELPSLSTEEVAVKILHGQVGGITESDVLLADASDAIIIGFNVGVDDKARTLGEEKGVDIRTYRVIYKITEELRTAMEQKLEPEEREVVTAQIDVRKIFKASAIGTIAGCYVTKGTVERTNTIRVLRDGIVRHEGALQSLKRMKDDAKEVREGFECGIVLDGFHDIQEGDRFEAFKIEKIARKLAAAGS